MAYRLNQARRKVLIGNSFPLSLVRRHRVEIEEIGVEALRRVLAESEPVSYWGHENSRTAAERVVSVSLKPDVERPAMTLDGEGFPMLDGQRYTECHVLSPDYAAGYRPAIGAEVPSEAIRSWHALRLTWK